MLIAACAVQLEMRRNRLASSTTAQHEVHANLVAAIVDCQAAVHAALLDNIDTATAIEELLSASRLPALETERLAVAYARYRLRMSC